MNAENAAKHGEPRRAEFWISRLNGYAKTIGMSVDKKWSDNLMKKSYMVGCLELEKLFTKAGMVPELVKSKDDSFSAYERAFDENIEKAKGYLDKASPSYSPAKADDIRKAAKDSDIDLRDLLDISAKDISKFGIPKPIQSPIGHEVPF